MKKWNIHEHPKCHEAYGCVHTMAWMFSPLPWSCSRFGFSASSTPWFCSVLQPHQVCCAGLFPSDHGNFEHLSSLQREFDFVIWKSHILVLNAQKSVSLNYRDFINFPLLQFFLLHKFITCKTWCTQQNARCLLSPLKVDGGVTVPPGFRKGKPYPPCWGLSAWLFPLSYISSALASCLSYGWG